jgi:hypothetical protein
LFVFTAKPVWDPFQVRSTLQTQELCREWQRQVTSMQAGRRVGMLWMDVTEMLNGLKRALERSMSVLCMVLEVSSHNKLSTVLADVQGAVKRIKERPGALLPFSEYLADLTAIQARQDEILAGSAAVKVRWAPSMTLSGVFGRRHLVE